MAQTTTSYNACDVHILLDNAAGTPVDISGSSNALSCDLDEQHGDHLNVRRKRLDEEQQRMPEERRNHPDCPGKHRRSRGILQPDGMVL